ncbi:molybdenum cofactor guanylyltransferase [Pseudarthrobacter oxydans]|uniref:molybdenum cofactor guanylyltransferase n=1 Tax=Pseudarthrobacter oxydans TaxID=1671 RepID=UPI002937CAC3|nr:NTP transferase domain-containing protein [Actinomycetes bacterium ARC8]
MEENPLPFDALILAGGRSSRLGGVPKQDLVFHHATLLQRALAAAAGASSTVIVGPRPESAAPGVIWCREEPEFAGPAAAIAAGLDALAQLGTSTPEYTLVLACDMPLVQDAVAALKDALTPGENDGVVARSGDGVLQPLAGIYRTAGLIKSAAELSSRGALINGSVRSLLATLEVQPVTVPAGSTADVDTWDDAAALGIAAGNQDKGQGRRSRS